MEAGKWRPPPESMPAALPAAAPEEQALLGRAPLIASGGRTRSKSYTSSLHRKSTSSSAPPPTAAATSDGASQSPVLPTTGTGGFLSRLPFFRTVTPEASSPATSPSAEDTIPFPDVLDIDAEAGDVDADVEIEDLQLPSRGTPALAGLFDVAGARADSRRRKGSLRKAALLGTGRLRLDRRFSGADGTRSVKSPAKGVALAGPGVNFKSSPRAGSLVTGSQDSSSAFGASTGTDLLSPLALPAAVARTMSFLAPGVPQLQTEIPSLPARGPTSSTLLSPMASPTGAYASTTTSDDDAFTIPSSTADSASLAPSKPSPSPSPPSSESSVVTDPSLISSPGSGGGRRGAAPPSALAGPTTAAAAGTSKKPRSPLSAGPPLLLVDDFGGEWDYSATEWWGWTILGVTWVVFVVGMGSCLGVWSWAWDVGRTPYAPPELEDDPTLPIVGYYPALLVLTAVVAWIWVAVAWMGMKYFKHARTQEI